MFPNIATGAYLLILMAARRGRGSSVPSPELPRPPKPPRRPMSKALRSVIVIACAIAVGTSAFYTIRAANNPWGIVKGVNGQWPIIQCGSGATTQACGEHWVIGSGSQDPPNGQGSDGDLFWRNDLLAFRTRTAGVWGALSLGTASFPLLAPEGSFTNPAYGFVSGGTAGLLHSSASSATFLTGMNGSGTDVAGEGMQISAGKGTGAGIGGQLSFAITVPSTTGTGVNSLQTAMSFSGGNGNITMGNVQVLAPSGNSLLTGASAKSPQTDIAGAGVSLRGGTGTGAGVGGDVNLAIAPPSATGTAQNSWQNFVTGSGTNGSVNIGAIQLLTPGLSTWAGASATAANTAGGGVTIKGGAATNGNANGGDVTLTGGTGVGSGIAGQIIITGRTFANLGTPANGAIAYCSDCTIAATCAGAGNGALAKRLNAVWVCN